MFEVSGGKDTGKAGLAILRKAGVTIEVLEQDDVEGSGNKAKRERLERRNETLEKALKEVEDKIAEKVT